MTLQDYQGFSIETSINTGPPAGLPIDGEAFWARGFEAGVLSPPSVDEPIPALKRLGPPPFARGGFPLIGFLETVYGHIADHAREAGGSS